MNLPDIVDRTHAYYCLDCGICTGSCPVSRVTPDFSPRLMVEKVLMGEQENPFEDINIWSCLSCGQCSSRCPSNIDYPEFVRMVREEAVRHGKGGVQAHRGLFQGIMRLQTLEVKQSRTEWAREIGRISDHGDTYFFVGCSPFFEVEFLDDWGLDVMDGPRGVLKLLNTLGIEPIIHDDERCCGHDLMWNGDRANFARLAQRNVDLIRGLGVKRVVFHCPEGYLTFKKYYPEVVGELGFEPVHFYELLASEFKKGSVELDPLDGVLTYHDPCRLGRQAGIMDAPRNLIAGIPGVVLREMEHNRENGLCCGTSAWMNCSACSKEIQKRRLDEAVAVGADTLVTACPKCRVHLNCALRDTDKNLKIRDINDLLAQALKT
ncbi:MAG: (Fe-S)-binding protein [Deltaproteobacteria bacterium]|nr:(Fe-S)-binding protein [Deltaproteobacteria bacterium]